MSGVHHPVIKSSPFKLPAFFRSAIMTAQALKRAHSYCLRRYRETGIQQPRGNRRLITLGFLFLRDWHQEIGIRNTTKGTSTLTRSEMRRDLAFVECPVILFF